METYGQPPALFIDKLGSVEGKVKELDRNGDLEARKQMKESSKTNKIWVYSTIKNLLI